MSKFAQGQLVRLRSDNLITGVVVEITEGHPENTCQVFTTAGMQTYYESQIEGVEIEDRLEQVDVGRFHAGITASLIRNPSISSLYSLNTANIDFIPHQFRPVLKFIRSDRPRLLIADGVGVGKTIEAGDHIGVRNQCGQDSVNLSEKQEIGLYDARCCVGNIPVSLVFSCN